MRNRRQFVSEINLTPLLDVLFSILFIVMMTGIQNEREIKNEYQNKVNQLAQQNEKLSEDLARSESQKSSYEKYQFDAVILTINNVNRNANHYLKIYQGLDNSEIGNIQMGIDKTENTKTRIESLILNLIEHTDNQPIYIIFYCDKKNIYTIEYMAVCDILNQLQENNKEVFFKVMKEGIE